MQSVKQLTDLAVTRCRERQKGLSQSPESAKAAREYALAITALEDAQMRFTRGLSFELGTFNPADLEAHLLASEGKS